MAKIASSGVKKVKESTVCCCSGQDEVAKAAYQLYLDRGGKHGNDKEDWARAEKIVKSRKKK